MYVCLCWKEKGMLQLLIVDDEPMFREGLIRTLDWKSLEVAVAGEAYNGLDALDFLRTNRVDLVLTDIRMPEMDGLELIRRASDLFPDIGFIVLSAFDDFHLVKQAFQLGIVDYILKTELEEKTLREVIQRQRDEQKRRSFGGEPGTGYAGASERLFVRQMLRSSVERRVAVDALDLPEKQLPFVSGDPVYSLLFQLHLDEFSRDEDDAVSLTGELTAHLETFLDSLEGWFGYGDGGGYLLFHFPGTTMSWRDFSIAAESLRQRTEEYLQSISNRCSLSAGFSTSRVPNLYRSMKEAEAGCSMYLSRGTGHTYGYSRYEESLKIPAPDIEARLRIFLDYLKKKDMAGLLQEVSTYSLESPLQINGRAAAELLLLYEKCYYHLLSLCEQMGMENGSELAETMDQFRVIQVSRSPLAVYHRWLKRAVEGIRLQMEGGSSMESRVARYIQENYALDLSLSGVAEVFKVNPSYLSRAFSRKHGKGFNTYLTDVRIARACSLLEEGSMRVYEVAEAVGISNAETFSRIFRRVTGKSPRDYPL